MFYRVVKQLKEKGAQIEPEMFIVEHAELPHFLHEQSSDNCVLVFDEFPVRNLYLMSNDED